LLLSLSAHLKTVSSEARQRSGLLLRILLPVAEHLLLTYTPACTAKRIQQAEQQLVVYQHLSYTCKEQEMQSSLPIMWRWLLYPSLQH
jgi:hypothetical protein